MEKMNNVDHPGTPVVLKVNVADKGVFEKRFTFNADEKVWAAKAQVIHEVSGKDPKDIQNYGFFVPPYQGKAGKFMDEGRPLSEYSLPGEDQSLEFMLKRRVYRSISFDENKLTKIHTKANLKKLMELVEQNNAGQVNQFLEKGLDPNFQDPKSGESPLSTAAAMDNSTEVIMFLVNGGAFMDFRNRVGLTAIHRAAAAGKAHNIKAFLDLGASPNYRDLKGLTPLYHACLTCKNPRVVELLLSDQSDIGIKDSQGWQEIHQTCRYGHIQHMEQLIYYGADLNAQNDTGNTPLHICSLYNQEDCARVLLYRGAKRDIVNFANQTAEMVALLASNAKLSEFIKNYSENDVVPHIDKPTYSTRRRNQSKPRPLANSVFLRDSTDTFLICSGDNSQNSSTPSLQSEVSEPLSGDISPRDNIPQIEVTKESPTGKKYKRSRTMSGGSASDSSYATDSGDDGPGSPMEDGFAVRWRTYSLSSLNKEDRGTVPRVKEVKGAANMSLSKKPNGKSHDRKRYEAVKDFHPTQAGELSLTEGDIVEVITKGEKGYWQGTVGAEKGWFPADCVVEYKKRKNRSKTSLHKPPSIASSLNKSNSSLDQPVTLSSPPSPVSPEPRQVILHKVKTGFGFQMRGANAPTVNKLEFQPSGKIPALQYIGEVEAGGEAEKSGLKRGDYILEVNGNDVRTASHRHVVSLIRKTGQNLIMKVISIEKSEQDSGSSNSKPPTMTRSNSLPSGLGPPLQNGTSAGDGGEKGKKPPPIPSRAPTTSLTARPKTERQSISDVNFDEPQAINQDDRVISVPRERISPTDTQWHSPLTGHASLPRRPKSSYGAIIGSSHETTEETTRWNYRPVEYLDNTGFMTLPSKPITPNSRQKGDNSIVRRRSDSGDRPKSWMPKVLPSNPPTTPPGQRSTAAEPVRRNSESKASTKSNEARKDKKRRFSFKKKKEKEYIAPVTQSQNDEVDNAVEVETEETQAAESLHIEGEESAPTTLPGLHHKRLTTFKPVTVTHHHHIGANEAVSPELSQALQKRKSRIGSDELTSSGLTTPENEHPHVGYPPPPNFAPPPPKKEPPKTKSLEESIRDEMRRRANTAPASNIPMKPKRTFEYKKLSVDESALEEQPTNVLDLELAKAVAKRAQKITAKEPEKPTHIYENINNFKEKEESPSPVEEPPTLTIEEKMKKLRLQNEVSPPPIKFKVPSRPPVGSKTRPVNTTQPVKAPPPKILPKPKKKPSTSETAQKPDNPREGLSLPLPSNQQMAYQPPPPVLSPEMVATQFLDDVIDEEVKNSNWDTESWVDKEFNSLPPSPNPDVFLPPVPTTAPPPAPLINGEEHHQDAPVPGKKKYVYKITLVTEKPSDGSKPVEHAPVITQIVTTSPTSKTRRSASDATDLPPPPPPPPPDSPERTTPTFSPPVSHTPPNSPPPPLPQEGTPVADIPPPVFDTPPPPVLSESPPSDVILPPPPVTPDPVSPSPPVAATTIQLPPSPVTVLPETTRTTEKAPLPPPPETFEEPPSPVVINEQPAEERVSEHDLQVDTKDESSVILPPPPPLLVEENDERSEEQPLPSPIVEAPLPSEKEETPSPKETPKAEEMNHSQQAPEEVVLSPPSQYKQETEDDVIIPPPELSGLVKTPDMGHVVDGVTDSGEPNINTTDTTETSDTNRISDVPALISDNNVDDNKNVLDKPMISTNDKEKLASPKLEASKDVGESSSFRDLPFEKWSCLHVCQWLESLGMSEHKNLFEENDIRGVNLVGLKKDDLRELGVKKLGHRMTIANEIITLTSNTNG